MKCEHADGENCKKYVYRDGSSFPCDGRSAKCAGKMIGLKEARIQTPGARELRDERPKRKGKYEVEEHRIPMKDEDIAVLHFAASYTVRNPPTKLKKGVEDLLKKWTHRFSMYPPKVGI